MTVIFFASSLPDPGPRPARVSDKVAHVIIYAALGAALTRALAAGNAAGMSARRIVAATLLATLYGASDELHQRFVPNRTPDLLDLLADACGGAIGAFMCAVLARSLVKLLAGRPHMNRL